MIAYFVKKRKITILFFLMAVLVGAFSFMQLPRQEMPDVVVRQAMVTTIYPGAAPQKVEQTVTKKLEQRIKEVKGVGDITSTSGNGFSSILVETEDNADPETVWDEMRKKVQDAQPDLPEDAEVPVINDNLASLFIGSYAIIADSRDSLYALNSLMTTWEDQLGALDGVSNVTISGLPEQEVRIDIDTQKLQQYHLPWGQVVQAVQGRMDLVPTGDVEYNDRTYQMIVKEASDPDQLNRLLFTRTESGSPVYLSDIGTVQLTHAEADYYAYATDKPAIRIALGAETGTDVGSMNERVNAKLAELKQTLPDDVQFVTLFAQQDNVDEIFADLSRETLMAIAAVILICTLGLNLLTSSFVALAIPVSVAIAMIFLPMLGVTLNQISVVGLIIVLGILVDDAVVVNDNIERRLTDLGETPAEAAVNGTKEVAISILTATLATISAFTPLLFLSGDVGVFIKPIPIVISLAMLASMLMSLAIIPIFREWYETRRLHKRKDRTTKPAGLLGRQIQSLTHLYSGKIMAKVVKRPLFTGLAGLLIGTAAYGLILFTPIELFPESEDPHMTMNVTMPVGTSLAETDRVVQEMAGWIQQQPETEKVAYAAGGGAPQLYSDLTGGSPSEGDIYGQISVAGKEHIFDLDETPEAWSRYFEETYPGVTITERIPRLGIPVGKPVSVRISGTETEQLQALTQQVREAIASIDGTTGITDDMGIERYALELEVNQQAMDQYQVSHADLTQTLLLLNEGLDASLFDTGSELIDIKVYLNQDTTDPNVLFQQLSVTNTTGAQIPLSQLVEVKPSFTIQQIKHYNLERTVTVEADLEGRTAADAAGDVQTMLAAISFPEGYSWEIGGETSDQSEIFADLGTLSIIVVFLILVLITIQFYSITIPLIIMTTVYLAAAGGILGIFLTGMPVGFMSIMGIIALAGIVVRNGIVMIEFIEDARHQGIELEEAVIQATAARFRPILLTSLTAIVGMLPIALLGSLLFKPLAYAIIFGLLFSTLLTLFVVPSLYMLMAQYKLRRELRKETKTSAEPDVSDTGYLQQ
ncbi:efflux RND transporter permease subunit [Paenibacillus sp. P96]|uniref:Efflux RND transporter permease subunit n=1 Tax=Paenibacillus zeirhizosphaerae TaxID=2987519 RepID=A0ABT9FV53_9BACL|nr:efflux RND transporter permease subunit [Paenibacillus sp. P96]MDP4098612.1 efflux RND transporter permease subunit [Paenibacillus sp. P96]